VSQVEAVALWASLLSAVVSTVLSIIAILFARDVDRRSVAMNDQTIRSLEAIRSTVQRLSEDTGGLIKVAWERMLGSVASPAPHDGDVQRVLSALLGEFRQDADELAPGTGVDQLAREMGERVGRVTARRNGSRGSAPKTWAFNSAVQAIESLTPLALELLRVLENGTHISRSQYRQLRHDEEVAAALDELRDEDLLVPVQRRGSQGEETYYGLAPWFREVVGPALVFTGHETPSGPDSERIADALRKVHALPAEQADTTKA
jgi:hypothetical protein